MTELSKVFEKSEKGDKWIIYLILVACVLLIFVLNWIFDGQ